MDGKPETRHFCGYSAKPGKDPDLSHALVLITLDAALHSTQINKRSNLCVYVYIYPMWFPELVSEAIAFQKL